MILRWRGLLTPISNFYRSHTSNSRLSVLKCIKSPFSTNDQSNSNKSTLVNVVFICPDGSERRVSGPIGQDLMRLAHANDIDLEGACEGSLACSTCHVVVQDPEMYGRSGEPSDEENDMLDLAFGLTETSRLGCQVKLATDLEGMVVRIPSATRNLAVDGFKPKPH